MTAIDDVHSPVRPVPSSDGDHGRERVVRVVRPLAGAELEPVAERPLVPHLAWRIYLVLGLISVAAFYAAPAGLGQDIVYVAVGLSGVIAVLVGVRLNQPTRRAPWLLMAAGQLTWVVGDAVDSWFQDVEHVTRYPSLADAFYLAAYPVLGWSLILLIRRRRSGRDVAGLLDSAIVTAGLGVLSWVLLAHPTMLESQQSLAASAVGVAYPVADILLIGLLVRLVTTPGGRTPSFRLLLTAVSLLVLGDTASDLVNLVSSSATTFDFLWLGSYVLWGAAALHPSMRSMSDSEPVTEQGFSRRRLVALTFATLTAPATFAVQLLFAHSVDGWAIVAGSVVLFLLVVGRMNFAIDQIVASNRDRDRLQTDLAYQASHDALTELPNRAHAIDLIQGTLHRAQRSGALIGLLFVDLDGFKNVNDTFGHAAGDGVLREVASRMQDLVRGGDVTARLGGDEFVVLLEPLDSEHDAVDIAHRLIAAISRPIVGIGGGASLGVGASVGISFNLDAHTDADRLLGEADAAAYRAKRSGRGRVEVFDDALRRTLSARADLEAAIASGLNQGEFVLHYQPIIDVATSHIRGYEALARWNRPGLGTLSPDEFIPVAEASNLVCDLGRWALAEAVHQLTTWSSQGVEEDTWVAVNISGRHLNNARIIDDVTDALRDSGLAPDRLVIELTETVRVDDLGAMTHLNTLRELGVGVSIDDFGTGYTSVNQLQHLPAHTIKIDRTFLSSAHPGSRRLLALLVEAAHAFGLAVIAEGVETADHLATLADIGCEMAQGFFIAPPRSADLVFSESRSSG